MALVQNFLGDEVSRRPLELFRGETIGVEVGGWCLALVLVLVLVLV